METKIKTKSTETARKQSANVQYQEPKRLSKAGIWKRENPRGIGIIIDHRAVNR